jgi:hypothetical protein
MTQTIEDTFIENAHILKGSKAHPLLAPRGVCLVNGHLFVADTGQNRVFIWKSISNETYQEPDIVLGQIDSSQTGRNAGAEVNGSTLQYPSGIWSDGQKLIVADAWNHRVLIWHTLPTKNGQIADVVIGQKDFTSNQPNIGGLDKTPSAQSLYWCYGVFSDGKHLWIADTGNRRVLFYENIPTENFTAADKVIGKESLTERDYDPEHAIWPYSVKISKEGKLAITDTQYYRVLLWNNWKDAFEKQAETIIGQQDFDSNGQNQFLPRPDAHTLNWCYDTCFHKEGIWVADTGNSRLLGFDTFSKHSGMPAQKVLGKPDFTTGSENAETKTGTEKTLYWPFSISIENDLMAIADTGNHRVILTKTL